MKTEFEQLQELADKIESGYYLMPGSKELLIADLEYLCKVYKKSGYVDGSDFMFKNYRSMFMSHNESIGSECKKIISENLSDLYEK
jgi:hypothetical protein